ncbi:DUF1592 domain-containing protein [Agaribacterium haliotis]|uniref:DUF1592 domain-containing protein n=1 Tax=Agaribacterium haliotis TaxID=2013869 RepID=UPI0013044550|nr:DUF1592 domain-containing protein [Agaribacterium haliotis]
MFLTSMRKLVLLAASVVLYACGGGVEVDSNANQAPTADFEYRIEGDNLVLDASKSFDFDSAQLSYSWYVNDELLGAGRTWRLAFDESLSYEVELIVSDGRSSSSKTLFVNGHGFGDLTGDVERGRQLYENDPGLTCMGCHGRDGQAESSPIDAKKTEYFHTKDPGKAYTLKAYLQRWMPPSTAPNGCDAQCAEDLEAYIRSWVLAPGQQPSPVPTVSPTANPIPSFDPNPNPSPNPEPSAMPTAMPTVPPLPSPGPSAMPSSAPQPSAQPTVAPTAEPEPSQAPTQAPTMMPTAEPEPSVVPSSAPEPSPLPSSQPPVVGDIERGEALYFDATMNCSVCHGDDGQSTAFKAIDASRAVYTYSKDSVPGKTYSLEAYLEAWMPAPGQCDAQCAADLAVYIRSWSSDAEPSPMPSSVPSLLPSPMPTTTPPAGDFNGDVAAGKAILKDTSGQCFTCHQDANEDGYFEAGAVSIRIDVNKFAYPTNAKYDGMNYTGNSVEDLARYISEQMPLNPASCVDECADDVAAYLWSLRGQSVDTGPTECSLDDPVLYGRRALKFLTSFEYHNSLQSLFESPLPHDYSTSAKIAVDDEIGSLPNHGFSAIGEIRVNSYDANAKEIADWAVDTGGVLPFQCTTASSCAKNFIEDFAYYAFRRPLSEDEKAEYTAMISEATKLEIGLKWAIRSALMSPQFLYRTELGESSAATLEKLNSEPDKVIYEPASEPIVVQGNSPANSGYQFTGNDLIIVTVTATPKIDYSTFPQTETDIYPAIYFGGGGVTTDPQPIGGPGPEELTFHVKDVTGPVYYMAAQAVAEINGEEFGGQFTVQEVKVAPAQIKEIPETFKEKVADADSDAYVLDDFEYASALSYMLTASAPDKALMKAALVGDLNNPEEVEKHVDRLIDSDLGREQVARFAALWFGTDRVRTVNRFGNDSFTPEVKAAMAEEIRQLFSHAFYDDSVAYTDLFDAEFTFVNKVLADFYGIAGVTGEAFEKVSTVGTERGGLIASGGFMALYAHDDRSSPIQRAVHVRQDMLCQQIPSPGELDDGDDRTAAAELAQQKEETGNLTTTEFYDIQTNVPGTGCAVCHNAVINPLFAIDNFDNVGLVRKTVDDFYVQTGLGIHGNDGIKIDVVNNGGHLYSANVVGAIDTTKADEEKANGEGIAFKGAKALSKALVENDLPGVDACLIQKTYRYALGAPLAPSDVDTRFEKSINGSEAGQMLCVQDDLKRALGSAKSPKAMLKQLSLSDVLRFRR